MIKCLFWYLVADYVRCGDDSEQCVRTADICNNVKNCLNGWDEIAEKCVDETQRSMFVTSGEGAILKIFKLGIKI